VGQESRSPVHHRGSWVQLKRKLQLPSRTLLILDIFSRLVVLHGVLHEYLFLGGASEEGDESKQAEDHKKEAENSATHVSQSESKTYLFSCITRFSGCMVDLCLYNFCGS